MHNPLSTAASAGERAMRGHRRPAPRYRPTLQFALFCIFLGVLWLAGGASRADAIGQIIVRTAAVLLLAGSALIADRPIIGRARPAVILLAAAFALPILQLVPLPPAIWTALPGHAIFEEAARASGQPQPWRPWSIVPSATLNAGFSLIVPFTVLVLVSGLNERERGWLPTLLLAFVTLSMIIGLLQFSGAGFYNPFVNDALGQVSGTFANRNHFALLLAFGCLLIPVWAFSDGRQTRWRVPVSTGLTILFVLTILATGSRAGLGLGALGLGLGLLLARRRIKHALRHYPRWMFVAFVSGFLAMILVAVILSIAANRAISIDRILAVDAARDIRSLARPTVLTMIGTYFPVGSGLGGFDAVFRLHEPLGLLKLTYFNHAHNDFLEIMLDAGLPGAMLLLTAIGWWVKASVRAWRADNSVQNTLAQVGSAMLLLVIAASIFDYPARTPAIMAFVMLAAIWLCGADSQDAA